jgi:hypothetical protein
MLDRLNWIKYRHIATQVKAKPTIVLEKGNPVVKLPDAAAQSRATIHLETKNSPLSGHCDHSGWSIASAPQLLQRAPASKHKTTLSNICHQTVFKQ